MKVLVTGAAGFIGSHLVDHLIRAGHDVFAIDSFTPYYARAVKERNLRYASTSPDLRFAERSVGSLTVTDLHGTDVVIHLAAQPGVRNSWEDFSTYVRLNLEETNTLADTIVRAGVPRVVFASSSSVYGDAVGYPTVETDRLTPRSPYGVTKQAGESLWEAYTLANELEVAALRFFTVYGPGQRPDMATQRLISAALSGESFTLFGTGEQRRDFTYISDIVAACVSAATAPLHAGLTRLNVGGSGDTSMNDLISLVETASGRRISLLRTEAQRGDVLRTGADSKLVLDTLGWAPKLSIGEGVRKQVAFELEPSYESWMD